MKKIQFIILASLALMALSCNSGKEPADLVILGGTIYTVNESQPVVEAVVVTDDKIEFAGTEKEARTRIGDSTKVIDLQGKTMTPGFIEGHAHFFGVGYFELDLDLTNAKNYDEVVEKVREAALQAQPDQWILGRGWHQDKWDKRPAKEVKGFQTHEKLSEVSPNNPVMLEHASGHAIQVNAKAMEIAGVNQLSKENLQAVTAEGSEIIRDENGSNALCSD